MCGLLLPCRFAYLGAERAHPSKRLLELQGGANEIFDQGSAGYAGYESIAKLVVFTDASGAAALRAQSKHWRDAVDSKIVEWTKELCLLWHAARADECLDDVREHVEAAFGTPGDDRHARFITEMLQVMQQDKYERVCKAVRHRYQEYHWYQEYRYRLQREQGCLGEEQQLTPLHYTASSLFADEQEARTMLEDVRKHQKQAFEKTWTGRRGPGDLDRDRDRELEEHEMNFIMLPYNLESMLVDLESKLVELCKTHEARRFQIDHFNYLSFVGQFDGAGTN